MSREVLHRIWTVVGDVCGGENAVTWHGEQGPFDDAVIGNTDVSGWRYAPVDYSWRVEEHLHTCERCGEWLTKRCDEVFDVFCWNCDDPVPGEWERQFEEAQ